MFKTRRALELAAPGVAPNVLASARPHCRNFVVYETADLLSAHRRCVLLKPAMRNEIRAAAPASSASNERRAHAPLYIDTHRTRPPASTSVDRHRECPCQYRLADRAVSLADTLP
jgi:hypothetical protein